MERIYKLHRNKNKLIYRIINNSVVKFFSNDNYFVFMEGKEEFDLELQDNDKDYRLLSSEMHKKISILSDDIIEIEYNKEQIKACVTYKIFDSYIEKSMTLKGKKGLKLKRINLENMYVNQKLSRGGEGQAVFIDDIMWCGMEFPVAQNMFIDNRLEFSQYPFFDLTNTFFSYPVIYSFRDDISLENSFLNFIKTKNIKNQDSLKIYCDWGKHDELSDNLNLSEKMCYEILDNIELLKKDYGINFDYYLMDAFWFERCSNYLLYKKETFPNGINKILDKFKQLKLKYGLWFDVNLKYGNNCMGNQFKINENEDQLCFACKEVSSKLEKALEYHIIHNNVKLIKFDFAYFECSNFQHSKIHSNVLTQSKEISVKAFIEMVARLKKIEPKLKVFAYNGFTTNLEYIGSVKKRDCRAVSPFWSEYIDYIYCGDPRPSEIACSNISNSMIYYTDSMIRQFLDALMPIENIDDHGTMFGNTGTIYWMGKNGIINSIMMNIMRGNHKFHLYGDLSMLDDNDKNDIKQAENIYDDVIKKQMNSNMILGNPINREVYGYSLTDGMEGYLAVVNPCSEEKNISVTIKEWKGECNILVSNIYSNKFVKKLKHVTCGNTLSLNVKSESINIYKWKYLFNNDVYKSSYTVDGLNTLNINLLPNTKQIRLNYVVNNQPKRLVYGKYEDTKLLINGKEIIGVIDKLIWSGCSWQTFFINQKENIFTFINNSTYPIQFYLEEK